ncbi:MAG: peptidylprolyl isomerase [Candidatus Zixiibacteriota bacterium]|nr:MAG: peptidylprolyl isomerase [candidate division Zixibacteria bacterium]
MVQDEYLVPEIFFSYASADRERVAPLAEALRKRGWTVWWDRKIPPGKTFDEVIKEGLAKSRCVIVVWSKRSVESRWVKTEASVALQRNKLVPVMIDQVEPPLEFLMIQAANLVDWRPDVDTDEFNQLVSAIAGLIKAPGIDVVAPDDDRPREVKGEPVEGGAEPVTAKPDKIIPSRRRWLRYVIVGVAAVVVGGVIYKIIPPMRPPTPTDPVVREDQKLQPPTEPYVMDENPHLIIETEKGNMEMELFLKESPMTASNFLYLVRQKFYDGLTWHRVIPGFIIQGGDPSGTGHGGPGYKIDFEVNDKKHEPGAVAMARRGDVNSAGSQFYIALKSLPSLDDSKYCVFGQLVTGLEIAKRIANVESDGQDKPLQPVHIKRIYEKK